MAFYAFALEPPLPRTDFAVAAEPEAEIQVSDFELVVANALMQFPEAYRAVVEEIRRWREKLRSP